MGMRMLSAEEVYLLLSLLSGLQDAASTPAATGHTPGYRIRKTRASIELPDSGLSRFVLSGL
jgi:hypothetical protein